MYRKILHPSIVCLILVIAGGPQTTLADSQVISSPPPELEFIYHDEWWAANSFSAEAAKYRTVAGDFNGDGMSDIAMLHRTNSTTVRFYVMLGAGDHFDWQGIWLTVSNTLTADMVTERVVAGDFNNDGFDDIAAFADDSDTILYVFLSDGSSGFSYHDWWHGDGNYDAQITGRVVAGDFDGDGWRDDIVALYRAGNSSTRADVFISDGTSFTNPQVWWSSDAFIANYTSNRVVAGDFDADEIDDLAMIYRYGTSETHVNLLHSSGTAFTYESRWWESTSYIADRTTGRVVAGDFDGDGDSDITLLYDYLNNDIRAHVLLSTRESFSYQGSVPGWWEHLFYNPSYATGRVVAGDWDGDGVEDVSMIYRTTDSSARAQVLEATAPSPELPTTRQVNADNPLCNDSFGTPFCTIQAAVDAASDGDTLQLADGGYIENVAVPKYEDPGFNQALTIEGAGMTSTFVNGSESGPVFTVHPGGNIILKSLTIRKGNTAYGGGIHIYSSNGFSGGRVTISDSDIQDNSATAGGGIYNNGGVLEINNSIIGVNYASNFGGGIYNLGGRVTISDSDFIANHSLTEGGGIANIGGGELTVTDSTLSINRADNGGGVFNYDDSTLTITSSTFISNTADNNGGGINNRGLLKIAYSTLSANTADDGGGMRNSGTLTVTNSTFSGNTATDHGGGLDIFNQSDPVRINNSTFDGNSAGNDGGGIYLADSSTLTITNSIVANSTHGWDCAGTGTWNTAGNPNLDSDGTCLDFTTGNPLLGSLGDNGGTTQTHALLDGSPAIDAGSNAVCPLTDQRGVSRPRDGDGDGSAICDLGAFEFHIPGIYLPLVLRNQ